MTPIPSFPAAPERDSSQLAGAGIANPTALFASVVCSGGVLGAVLVSFFAPQVGQLCVLLACMLCARYCGVLLPLALTAYAHAGASVLASRALESESSDFAVYYDTFRDICSGTVPLRETLSTFGLEWGLPASYHVVAAVGGCGLSIHGLAYLQTLLVSTALFIVLAARSLEGRSPDRAALVLGGMLAMFSFIYVTQLARQTISSLFVLLALFESRRFGRVLAWLALATVFHLSAPLVYALARLLRSSPWIGLAMTAALVTAATAYGTELLEWGLARADDIPGLDKLAYYAIEFDADESVGSDMRAVVYLGLAAAASLRWRFAPGDPLAKDLRMLSGFGLLALAVLALPLAATRLTLAFSAIAVGYYLFKAIADASPRIALLALTGVVFFRSGLFAVFGPAEQTLWKAYDAYAWWPLYYIVAF
jgi:hypothetical protein